MVRQALVLLAMALPFSAFAQSQLPESAPTPNAVNLELIADFPLTENGDDSLSRNPGLSTADIVSGALFSDSGYRWQPGHPMKAVATINDLNYESFTVSVDLKPIAYTSELSTLLVGGTDFRWISLRNNQGRLELAFNNGSYVASLRTISNVQVNTIPTGEWSNIILSLNLSRKIAIVSVNGVMLKPVRLPSQFALEVVSSQGGQKDKRFTFTDYRNANTYNGYARNLRVYNRSIEPTEIASISKRVSTAASGTVAQGNAIAGPSDNSVQPKPSFDCSKAKSAAARLICSDLELSKADGALGAQFKSALSGKDDVAKKAIVDQQLAWLRERNARCGVGPDKASVPVEQLTTAKPCMMTAIQERIAFLGTGQSQTSSPTQTPKASRTATESTSPAVMVRNSILEHWNPPAGGPSQEFTIRFSLNKNGTVSGPVSVFLRDGPGEPELRASVLDAVFAAAPYTMLRPETYETWQRIEVTLDPKLVVAQTSTQIVLGTGCLEPLVPAQGPDGQQIASACKIGTDRYRIWCTNGKIIEHGNEPAPSGTWGFISPCVSEQAASTATALQPQATDQNSIGGLAGLAEGSRRNYEQWARNVAIERQQAQQNALVKQALRTKVQFDLGYQSYVRTQELIANPFVYKGTVVALQTVFERMLSENDAVFTLQGAIVVTGVPPTMFRGNEMVILAIKVLGAKDGVPYGEYVAVYKCAQYGCPEYFDN